MSDQHSTAQHSTAQHSTAQHSTAQHSTAQHSTAHHSTAQRSSAQHSTAVVPIQKLTDGPLFLCRCPFLALSATIGNPEQVTEWLQSVKELQQEQDTQLGIASPSQRYKVNLIQHAERYADLRYYSFKPAAAQQDDDCPEAASTAAPASQGNQDAFNKIHPCAVLTAAQLQDSSFPSELSLEPCDCLELANAMHDVLQTALLAGSNFIHVTPATGPVCELTKIADMHTLVEQGSASAMVPGPTVQAAEASSAAACLTDQVDQWRTAAQAALHTLSADTHFPDGKPISRSAVRVWEKALKQELVVWATVHGSVGLQATAQVLAQLKASSAWDPRTTFTNESYNPIQFYSMMRALERQDMLPALTFSFERRKCERLAGKSLCPVCKVYALCELHVGMWMVACM